MNRSICLLSIFLLALAIKSKAQVYHDTLDVATWNLHEFGSDTTQHKQATNIKNVMNKIGADIYACEEVINVDSFKWLAENLDGNFGCKYSYYGGGFNVNDTSNAAYAKALKFGFLYRKSMFRNIQVRPLMKTSAGANANFYGRFPFLVKCELLGADNNWSTFYFIIVHAACCPDDDGCNRRTAACHELKDTLDKYYSTEKLVILGDFNDDLDTSICTHGRVSNYSYLADDSVKYKAITLPYSRLNIGSLIGYKNMIDHIVVSDEVASYFIPNSVQIYKSYSWANTSDHHPVKAKFVVRDRVSSIAPSTLNYLSIFPNPASTIFTIKFVKPLACTYRLLNAIGSCVASGTFLSDEFQFNAGSLVDGFYMLEIRNDNGESIAKKVVIRH